MDLAYMQHNRGFILWKIAQLEHCSKLNNDSKCCFSAVNDTSTKGCQVDCQICCLFELRGSQLIIIYVH